MRLSLRKIILANACGICVLLSCSCGVTQKSRSVEMKEADIISGLGEPKLTEKYHLSLHLPMNETEFLAVLAEKNLHYSICGEKGSSIDLPPPRQVPTVDFTRARKCYEIDGDVDPVRHVGERYRAFVDDHHQVFYIENAFSYTGP